MSSGSNPRPQRRSGGSRSGGSSGGARRGTAGSGGSKAGRGQQRDRTATSRASGDRPSANRRPGKRAGDSGGRGDGRRTKPLTEAERRALVVKARRAPRSPRDPELERQRIEGRTTEEWHDEGSVRGAAADAARRASGPSSSGGSGASSARRPPRPIDPETSAELVEALGSQRGARLSERLGQAADALDRERFQEARRVASSIAKEAPMVAAAHELAGLAGYRLGLYKQAAAALETAQSLHDDPSLLPVIADCYRAQRRWSAVERIWSDIKAASPSHEIMAEGRIVAAGARADQDDLRGAIELMEPATKRPKAVRDFHLRQWYVLGDLYDRVGEPIAARRWFAAVADVDPDFADVEARLRGLGR